VLKYLRNAYNVILEKKISTGFGIGRELKMHFVNELSNEM